MGWSSAPAEVVAKVLRACVAGRTCVSARFIEGDQLWTQKAWVLSRLVAGTVEVGTVCSSPQVR